MEYAYEQVESRNYETDISDENWELIKHLFEDKLKVFNTKRHIMVDELGNGLGVVVSSANRHDSQLLGKVLLAARKHHPEINFILADKGYRGQEAMLLFLKCEIEISGSIGAKDNRWVVGRSFSWFNWQRRLAKDYEKTAESHAAFCIIAFIANALHKLDKLSISKKH